MDAFLGKYSIASFPEELTCLYEKAKALYREKGADILDFERYAVFTYMADKIAGIRDHIAGDADNILYAYLLYLAIKSGDDQAIAALSCPNRHLEDENYDLLPLFSVLYCIPDQVQTLRAKGVPEDIIKDTLGMYENQTQDYVDLYHRMGISVYVSWLVKFVRCEIIRVGRFNLEICTYDQNYDIFKSGKRLAVLPEDVIFHRCGQVLGSAGCNDSEGSFTGSITETDDSYVGLHIENGVAANEKRALKKSEWQKCIVRGDRVIGIHLPSGAGLEWEGCREDLRRGKEIIDKHFGETKGFICQSWFLDPQLKGIIGRESNLTRFAGQFELFPMKSTGLDVFEYVFVTPSDVPLEVLPVKNRFARAVKDHLLAGGHIWGAQGVLLEI